MLAALLAAGCAGAALVSLPHLPPGRYALVLEVEMAGSKSVVERAIEVGPPPARQIQPSR